MKKIVKKLVAGMLFIGLCASAAACGAGDKGGQSSADGGRKRRCALLIFRILPIRRRLL